MLTENSKQICEDYIQSAILYCNENLKYFSKKELQITCGIDNEADIKDRGFIAFTPISSPPYNIIFHAELFEDINNILFNLLSEENKNFYFCVCNDKTGIYNSNKAEKYQCLLFQFAVKFVIYHELGHIFNGHIDLIFEEYESDPKKMLALDRQALEMDADAFAATHCVGQLTYQDNISNINNQSPELISNIQHGFLLCIISACIVFSWFGQGEKRTAYNSINELNELKYLPLRTRQYNFILCAINAFNGLNHNKELVLNNDYIDLGFIYERIPNVEEYVNLYLNATTKDKSQNSTKNKIYSMNYSKSELNPLHINHLFALEEYWKKNMVNRLKKYSHYHIS